MIWGGINQRIPVHFGDALSIPEKQSLYRRAFDLPQPQYTGEDHTLYDLLRAAALRNYVSEYSEENR